ncbi:MAG: Asp-tRNA(Asn)/Glu-tRNA(Gln) amidotransferase GatCAB subunit B, partial [Chloroflexi bacterium]|nr:Asp-tRNA(Asn)/Glu-tRNA(Gln) amidotransferase GatCAB subunit B [Chloroflexota bacterium]
SQRTKEYAHDYRYFPEPDLPPLVISRAWVEKVRARLPELPEARRDRFISEYSLPRYDANLLTGSKAIADYFETALKLGIPQSLPLDRRAKTISNWLLGEFSRLLNLADMEMNAAKVSPEQLTQLLDLIEKGTINIASAKTVFEEMFNTGKPCQEIVSQRGLVQISDVTAIEAAIVEAIRNNPQAIADYKAGKTQSMKFLVGQVMKVTKGRANPKLVNELLDKKLKDLS